MAPKRKGLSEREYAERIGRSRVSVQDLKRKGKIVLHGDGSIDPEASDARMREASEKQEQRGPILRNDRAAGVLIDR